MQAGLVRSSHCSEEEEGESRGAFYLASPVKPTHRQSRPKVRDFNCFPCYTVIALLICWNECYYLVLFLTGTEKWC
jgi:hypothetical protein